jgi:hypothetical protein
MPRSFYRNSSYAKILAVLEWHGFVIKQGGDHIKAFCNEHQVMIILPRSRKISSGVSRSIANSLMKKCGVSEDELMARMF